MSQLPEDPTRVSGGQPGVSPQDDLPTRLGAETTGDGPSGVPSSAAPGLSIARYRILGKLGEGGMGVVYEAEQDSPRRRVALKLVRGGRLVDDMTRRMFEREVETLARLNHPDIAAIYDSGTTDDGQLYFAMELVEGRTLGSYLAGRPRPVTRAEIVHRLRVLMRIAAAVHHAHQRGVIHRDLKPGNVIVGESASAPRDGSGPSSLASATNLGLVVKILDFGLARALDAEGGDDAGLTRTGMIKGTLAYMSPEQTKGDPAAVDVRADVYALGVMLHEALTGERPYTVSDSSILDAVRVICETPPRALRAASPAPALIDADLATIVATALEKDPARRYASAAALVVDLERYLTSQPILARPPSTIYQLTLFTKRHRGLVAAAAAVILAIAGGAVVATTQAIRARHAEAEARERLAESEAVIGVLEKMLASADPELSRGREVTVREILDTAGEELDRGSLAGKPLVEAAVRETLGSTYRALSRYEESERQLRRAIELAEGVENSPLRRAISAHLGLVNVLIRRNAYDEANSVIEETRALRARMEEPDPRLDATLESLTGSYFYHRGDNEAALAAYQRSLSAARAHEGDEGDDTLSAMTNVGFILSEMGRNEEAIEIYRKVLEIRLRNGDPLDGQVLRTKKNLADTLRSTNAAEAVALYREALDGWRVLHEGEDHFDIISGLSALGMALTYAGQVEEAAAVLEESAAMAERVFGPENHEVAFALAALADVRRADQRFDEALALATRARDIRGRAFGEESAPYASSLSQLARTYLGMNRDADAEQAALRAAEIFGGSAASPASEGEAVGLAAVAQQNQGRMEEAEVNFRRALTIAETNFGDDDSRTLSALDGLAAFLYRKGLRDEPLALFERVLAAHRRMGGDKSASVAYSLAQIAYVLEHEGRPEEALTRLEERLAITRELYPPHHAEISSSLRMIAGVLSKLERFEEAKAYLREEVAAWEATGRGDSPQAHAARSRLGVCLSKLGRFDEAERLLLDAEAALRANPATPPDWMATIRQRLADFYDTKGDPASAARWR